MMTEEEMKTVAGIFAREVGVLMEDVHHKLDLVVEGHQLLADKIGGLEERVGRVEERLVRVEAKVDAVALDLTAHRNDTEAHLGVYRVREA